MLAITIRC